MTVTDPKSISIGRNFRPLIMRGSRMAVQRESVATPIMQIETLATLTARKKVIQWPLITNPVAIKIRALLTLTRIRCRSQRRIQKAAKLVRHATIPGAGSVSNSPRTAVNPQRMTMTWSFRWSRIIKAGMDLANVASFPKRKVAAIACSPRVGIRLWSRLSHKVQSFGDWTPEDH